MSPKELRLNYLNLKALMHNAGKHRSDTKEIAKPWKILIFEIECQNIKYSILWRKEKIFLKKNLFKFNGHVQGLRVKSRIRKYYQNLT